MKSRFIELGSEDQRAIDHFSSSLRVCAHDHILSKKLLDHFATRTGTMFAIVGDWLELDQMATYDQGTQAPVGSPPYAPGDYPQDRLVAFVKEYVANTEGGIVVCENWAAHREHVAKWPWPPPRIVYYGNEVYHIVTRDLIDLELIEAAVEARHHWQTNVCSSCNQVPAEDIQSEAFIDEIVRNTRHIFVPAFDGTGYLIWSDKSKGRCANRNGI